MTGLTQAEIAQRAGVTRQVIGRYESGERAPSIATLDRLLAGCGVRLRLLIVPEAGLEDLPTRELLARPVLERLDFPLLDALVDIAEAIRDPSRMLVSGKAAARLHGACVRVDQLDIWFPPDQPVDAVRTWLAAAGIVEPYRLTQTDLHAGVTVSHGPADAATALLIRNEPHFQGFLDRSSPLDLGSTEAGPVWLVEPGDCSYGWHPRDRDHLALQRAVRLAAEQAAEQTE
jgi:transcriptional regulator with XRE-family HTH domain